MVRTHSRRDFLLAGAAGTTMLWLGWPQSAPATTAPGAATQLSGVRRRTYAALVEAVGLAPHNQIDAHAAAAGTARFAADYEARQPEVQIHVDQVLDALHGHRFSRIRPGERLKLLRSWSRAMSASARPLRELALDSLVLAGLPFQPDPEEFGPVPVTI